MSRRPPSARDPQKVILRALPALNKTLPGAITSRAATPLPRPLPNRASAAQAGVTVASTLFAHNRFVLASATPTLTLTHEPLAESLHLYLNGIYQDDSVDYTLTGASVAVLSAMGAISGDIIEARYAYMTAAPTLAPSGVSVLWKLDETSGSTAADSSGNGYDGTYAGTPGFSATSLLASGAGYSVTFSGDDAVVIAAAAWMDVTTLTAEAFIKTTGTGIMSIWDRDTTGGDRVFQMRVNASGKLEFINTTGIIQTVTGVTTVNDGAKHHVAVVAEGTGNSIRLYVDGVQDASATQNYPLNTASATRLALGRNNSAGGSSDTQFFVGQIDEAAFYAGTVLTAAQIAVRAAQ